MFESGSAPRLFGVPPGSDFVRCLVSGLHERLDHRPPDEMAGVELFVNTRRMQRRIGDIFAEGAAGFLPQVRLLTELERIPGVPTGRTSVVTPLRQRLELARLVRQLIASQPDLAPPTAAFDLAGGLAGLIEEMHGEDVSPDVFHRIDVTDHSDHWNRTLSFLQLIAPFFDASDPGPEARRRIALESLLALWKGTPPDCPVIVAGSSGSRGTTRRFMLAAARLPQGALVLPGFDFDLPPQVWNRMMESSASEDHPQFRFAELLRELELGPEDVRKWTDEPPPNRGRNRLVSLALRPAPVTDQWMTDGPRLDNIPDTLADAALLEAQSPREEAAAIALLLRKAAEDGKRAALVAPGRELARRVAAALDRWNIVPDDSAGRPLAQSAPGRFLRHVAALFGQRLTGEALLALLKHPLANTGSGERGHHLFLTRELELWLRDRGPAFPSGEDLIGWAGENEHRKVWAQWLNEVLRDHEQVGIQDLSDHVDKHLRMAEALAAGPSGDQVSELWKRIAGREAGKLMEELRNCADVGGPMPPSEYAALLQTLMREWAVRDPPDTAYPGIAIWGSLEVRALGADLVILGGLNEGVWPAPPLADPWFSREMRQQAGLLPPERRIGLFAHDFQQAIAAPEVWLTRAVRDAEAETVPSRWLNRVTNLLGGLPEQGGQAALTSMRERGDEWLKLTRALETRADSVPAIGARRPSPRPPVAQRPRRLSVTRIETLIRDPFAIYARYVLGLKPLDPIRHEPDAPLRGIILHEALEKFLRENGRSRDDLMRIAGTVLDRNVPWPAARRIWLARLGKVADWFVETEAERRRKGKPLEPEQEGALDLVGADFTLTAKADRFDRARDGSILIYDYKTGRPPTRNEQIHFNKQLLLEAAMVERGGFPAVGKTRVSGASFIGLGSIPSEVQAPLDEPGLDQIWQEFRELINAYSSKKRGYTSRRAFARRHFEGDYDHLARFGEWNETDDPQPEDMP